MNNIYAYSAWLLAHSRKVSEKVKCNFLLPFISQWNDLAKMRSDLIFEELIIKKYKVDNNACYCTTLIKDLVKKS